MKPNKIPFVLMSLTVAAQLWAVPCPINNPSFEDPPVVQPPFTSGTPPGWTGTSIGVNGDAGWYRPNVTQYSPLLNTRPGSLNDQMAYIVANGTIFQTLTEPLAANMTYTLSGFFGHRADDAAGNWFANGMFAMGYVQILAGTTVLANLDLSDPGQNNINPFSLTYTSPSSSLLFGTNLTILLGFRSPGDHPQGNFDNIAMDCSTVGSPTQQSVPEGGMSVGLLVIGLLGIVSFRRVLEVRNS